MAADNLQSWRSDAIAVLKSLRPGVYRWSGGNFVSAHDWRYAIGDPDKRPPIYVPVWRAAQPNDIGTDEFMTLCKLLGVEPYVTVNVSTGDAWSAAELVKYYNGDAATTMGKQRAANGHPEWLRRPADHIRPKYEEYKDYEKLFPQLITHPRPLNIDEWAYSSRGGGVSYPTYPAYDRVFHEIFRHSDLMPRAAQTCVTSWLARDGTNVSLTANGLVFKFYRDQFGRIPVEVAGNSP